MCSGTLDLGTLSCCPVSSLSEALSLLQRGQQQRHAAATAANARSSRSHAILRIVLTPSAATATAAAGAAAAPPPTAAAATTTAVRTAEATAPAAAEAPPRERSSGEGPPKDNSSSGAPPRGPRRASVLSLVDLAGSESAGGPQGPKGGPVTQREGGSINRSLLALSKVVKALTQQQQQQQQQRQQQQQQQKQDGSFGAAGSGDSEGPPRAPSTSLGAPTSGGPRRHLPPFVGLRETKLTRLLSDCLGGHCKTSVICLCVPGVSFYRQTAATLTFARRARKIPPPPEEGGPQGGPQGPPKPKRPRTANSETDNAAAAAATAAAAAAAGPGGSEESAQEGLQGSSLGGPQGGLHRSVVYVPTGCLQCRSLYKALQEAREEIAWQRVQLRQLKYVVSRGLPSAAPAAAPAAAAAAAAAPAGTASNDSSSFSSSSNSSSSSTSCSNGSTSSSYSYSGSSSSTNSSYSSSSSNSSYSSSSNSSSTPRRTERDKLWPEYSQSFAAAKENAAAAPQQLQQLKTDFDGGTCYKPSQQGAPLNTGGPLRGPPLGPQGPKE